MPITEAGYKNCELGFIAERKKWGGDKSRAAATLIHWIPLLSLTLPLVVVAGASVGPFWPMDPWVGLSGTSGPGCSLASVDSVALWLPIVGGADTFLCRFDAIED